MIRPLGREDERLRRQLIGDSHRYVARDLENSRRESEDLRQRFIRWVDEASLSTQDLAWRFVLHEASVAKLTAAVGIALRSAARRGAGREDLISEALLLVHAAFGRHRDLGYVEARGRFDSWLYTIWKNAVGTARRPFLRGPALKYWSNEQLERVGRPAGRTTEVEAMPDIRTMMDLITELPAGRLREVMLDWASGMSGAESARVRGVSGARVSQLRSKGEALVRERLGLKPPARPG